VALFDVDVASMGSMPLPGPEVFWMQAWDEWFDATFWMVVARDGEHVVVINTGPPDDLADLNALWRASHPSGRSQFTRLPHESAVAALGALGIRPEDVTHVILTPIVAYTVGSLRRFPNATITFSRRGWIEDVLAPPRKHHLPRHIFVPDDLLKWLLFEAKDRIRLVDGSAEVLPGITAWESGVHHRSSMVVEIATASGIVSVTDSAFAYRNVEDDVYLGIGESYAEAMSAYQRIRETAGAVIPLYDPEVAVRFPGGKVVF
jgi:glyoxylase-like metal-dependent hydrolase (beta-lactamase superfamily II)